MGFVRTVNQIAKELGRSVKDAVSHGVSISELRNPWYTANELYRLLHGALKVNPKEYGRFGQLEFAPIDDYAGNIVGGEYFPGMAQGRGVIRLNSKESLHSKLEDFLHELAHAKQFRPDPDNLSQMRDWEAASGNLMYYHKPIEVAARKVAKIATPDPSLFTKAFNRSLTDPEINMLVAKGLAYTHRPLHSDVKPFSGKNWLFSAVPLFTSGMLQRGRED